MAAAYYCSRPWWNSTMSVISPRHCDLTSVIMTCTHKSGIALLLRCFLCTLHLKCFVSITCLATFHLLNFLKYLQLSHSHRHFQNGSAGESLVFSCRLITHRLWHQSHDIFLFQIPTKCLIKLHDIRHNMPLKLMRKLSFRHRKSPDRELKVSFI